ncbi:Histone H2A Type 2-A [Manis pentadactyla]|nr:Histone H2A Type 2-A [Manis pentadactyla]
MTARVLFIGQLRLAGRGRRARVAGGGAGVPDRRGPGAAGKAARDKETRITPRPLQLAIRNDEELRKLLGKVTIMQGGVLPNIQAVLLPEKTASHHKAKGRKITDTCGLHIALISKEQSLGEKIPMATMTKSSSTAEKSKYSQDKQADKELIPR